MEARIETIRTRCRTKKIGTGTVTAMESGSVQTAVAEQLADDMLGGSTN
jgi:hypothetical protein